MGLTEREKKIIEEMEAALTAEDPRLVASMEERRPNILLNVLAILLGIGLIIAGVIANFALLGIAGFLVALAGAATMKIGRAGGAGGIGRIGMKKPNSGKIQERWDKRSQ